MAQGFLRPDMLGLCHVPGEARIQGAKPAARVILHHQLYARMLPGMNCRM